MRFLGSFCRYDLSEADGGLSTLAEQGGDGNTSHSPARGLQLSARLAVFRVVILREYTLWRNRAFCSSPILPATPCFSRARSSSTRREFSMRCSRAFSPRSSLRSCCPTCRVTRH